MNTDYNDYRISKLREYLIKVINEITNDKKYQINANMLDNEPNNYSLDKIPTQPEIENWIIPVVKKRDVFSFRNRKGYSQDTVNNLKNIGFFEVFQKTIENNNRNGIRPDIKGIEEIKCLNPGTMNNNTASTAEFDIQIQITYREEK